MKITKRKLRKIIREAILEEKKKKGLWANIHAKKKRGEKSNPRSKKYQDAKKAGKRINKNEADTIEEIDELEEADRIDKDKMKCNKKRYLRKGETGYGNKQKVVKACDNGKETIVKFGDAKMRNNRDKKKNRKSFRARMNCDTPGSKLKARYWACKDW
tara:strand:+ start:862 stop:1335 length:474 start_codon:yes stop_codon:yes gene_type:complete